MEKLSYRSFGIERARVDKAARVVEASFSSDMPAIRGYGEIEILSHEDGAVDLARAKDGLPLLWSHNHDIVIGVAENLRLGGGKLRGDMRFSESARGREVFADVESGILRNVSVGYQPVEREPIEGGFRVTRWELMEASIVSVPVDHTVGIHRAFAEDHNMENEGLHSRKFTLVDLQEAQRKERSRISEIRSIGRTARMEDSWMERMIDEGRSVDVVRREVLNELATRDEAIVTRSGASFISMDPGEHCGLKVRAMSEGLAARYGGPAPSDHVREFEGMRIVDMARQILERRGIHAKHMSPNGVIERALHSTSDFPDLLAGTGERILRKAYQTAVGGIKRVSRKSTAKNFRAKLSLQFGEELSLQKVNEHGEFKYGSGVQTKESYQLATYGRIFGITRQALVNDDLDAFGDFNTKFGRAAAELENQVLANLMTSNPVMSDGIAVFHASHGNLAATGGAISIATLGEGRKAIRTQKSPGAESTTIDVTPRYLIVPAALETVAEQNLTQISADQSSNANPFSGKLELVVDPRLDAVSTTAWYLAADSNLIDTIEYSHLEGEAGPQVFVRQGFEVDGIETKCRLDFGAGILDFRGLFKNPG